MTTQTAKLTSAQGVFSPSILALVIGLALLTVSGMAQATALHDAAHDQRHAMAFPCH